MVSEILVDAGEREDVDGILLQLPVPDHLDERFLCNLIPPTKDVDAHNAASIGNLVYGRGIFVPPTASAVAHCIQENGIDTFGKRVLVVGRSRHCGLPITLIMQGFRTHPELPDVGEATVTMAHRFTKLLTSFSQNLQGTRVKQTYTTSLQILTSSFLLREFQD